MFGVCLLFYLYSILDNKNYNNIYLAYNNVCTAYNMLILYTVLLYVMNFTK